MRAPSACFGDPPHQPRFALAALMNLRQLEVFYAIMQAGSVTAAARNLNVTPARHEQRSEAHRAAAEFKLFERIGGRLHPTPEAADLLPDVNEIFGRVDTLNRVVQEMRDGKSGRLLIATSPTLVNAFLPRAIALFRQRSPAVRIAIQSLPTPLVIERVLRREVDMGLVYAPVADRGVDAEELIVTEMACVLRKAIRSPRKRQITARGSRGRAGHLARRAHAHRPADRGRMPQGGRAAAGRRGRGELVAGGLPDGERRRRHRAGRPRDGAVRQVRRPRVPAVPAADLGPGPAHLHARPATIACRRATVRAAPPHRANEQRRRRRSVLRRAAQPGERSRNSRLRSCAAVIRYCRSLPADT